MGENVYNAPASGRGKSSQFFPGVKCAAIEFTLMLLRPGLLVRGTCIKVRVIGNAARS